MPPQTPELVESQLRELHAVARRFERDLRAGEVPPIPGVVAQTDPAIRGPLMRELMLLEMEYLGVGSDTLPLEDYLTRFSEQDQPIARTVFHELQRESSRPRPTNDEPPPGSFSADSETLMHPGHATESTLNLRQHNAPPETATTALDRLGRYHIERELGRGAMGTVYLAHDEELDRLVALKIPRFEVADGASALVERFQRESRAMATVEHPNICPIYDVSQVDGTNFLTMQYVQGRTLANVTDESGPFDPAQAVRLVRALAQAMQVAHDAGVVHRDLKPANVMINQRDEPVIMDFGLSRRDADAAALPHEDMIVGSPAYMAPEQIRRAAGAEPGPQSDVYALGVILFEILCGERPFSGPVLTVLSEITTQAAPRVTEIRPEIDSQLADICAKALARDLSDRFSSAAEFANALEDWESARSAPDARTPSPWSRVGALAGVIALLAALAVYVFDTPQGRVTVTAPDDVDLDVEIRRDGDLVSIINREGGWTAQIDEGEYQVRLRPDGHQSVQSLRIIGGTTLLVTSRDGGHIRIERDAAIAAVNRVADAQRKLLPPLPVPTRSSTGEFYDSGQQLGKSTSFACAAGDFDGDGDIDVVVANAGEEADRVWLNDGAGIFEPGQELPGADSIDVKAGDLDADGDLDVVVVANSQTSPGTVWINNGSGEFQDSGYGLGPINTKAVALGDVDGDGDLDAVTCHDGANRVWENVGAGQLRDTGQRLGSSKSRYLELGDLDGDGDLDLFTANVNHQPNRVWWNDGPGRFSDSGLSLGESSSNYVALADLDGDGDLDAMVGNFQAPNATWINHGQGIFTRQWFLDDEFYTAVVAAGDLNGDGAMDAFVGNGAVHRTKSAGVNQIVSNVDTNGMTVVWHGFDHTCHAALADFDSDGDLDIFLANRAGQPDRVLLNRNPGEPSPHPWPISFNDSGQRLGEFDSTDVALGDLDDDGDVDAVVANADNPGQLLLNRGDGRFEMAAPLVGDFTSEDVELADLDGDDDLDVFFASTQGPNRVWLNDGSAHLTDSGQRLGSSYSTGVALGDVNGDGDPDAWVANAKGPCRVWFNQGDGTFQDSGQALGAAYSSGVSLADLDGDSDLDAVVANRMGDKNAIWLNDGHGVYSLSKHTVGKGRISTTYIAAGDVDSDGDADLVVLKHSNHVWLNDGHGVFEPTGQVQTAFRSQHVALEDIDGDGDLDAFFSNGRNGSNGVWLNGGDGYFAEPLWLGGSSSRATGLADLDGDGDLDAFVANSSGEPDRVWLNESQSGPESAAGSQ